MSIDEISKEAKWKWSIAQLKKYTDPSCNKTDIPNSNIRCYKKNTEDKIIENFKNMALEKWILFRHMP